MSIFLKRVRILGYLNKKLNSVHFFFKYKPINLQLFAEGEKTEKATQKKRQDARKKGQVLQSREITSALVLLLVFVGLRLSGNSMYQNIAVYTKRMMTEYPKMGDLFTVNAIVKLFLETILLIIKVVTPVFAIAMVAGLIASYAQVGFLFTFETLGFKFERINPLKGFKRIFSLRALTELLKSVLKVSVIGFVAYSYLKGEAPNVYNIMDMDTMRIAIYIGTTCVNIGIRICMVLVILGILDYAYQWWDYEKSLKMSKQEIKEEFKQIEGNPEIKSKIKQKQREMSMKRILNEVPKADVVITNPTHFAVAVKYDKEKSTAPVVLAKGQDYIALRIKEVAKENKVEIVENKPLARTLYETVEIGQAIPPELYQAVAEVLAFVYSLKGKGRAE